MSDETILSVLLTATGEKPQKKREKEQNFLKRVALAVDELEDDQFDGLPEAAQTWAGDAAKALNADEEITSFPEDGEPAAGEDPEPEPGAHEPEEAVIFVKGDHVAVTCDDGDYPGVVSAVLKSGSLKVKFDDGDDGKFDPEEVNITHIEPEPESEAQPEKPKAEKPKADPKGPVGKGSKGEISTLRKLYIELALEIGTPFVGRDLIRERLVKDKLGVFTFGTYNTTVYHMRQMLGCIQEMGFVLTPTPKKKSRAKKK